MTNKNMKKCNCYSSNWGEGKTPTFKLNPNDYFKYDSVAKDVYVDDCIKHVIIHLWKNKIWTLNSCCGHNGEFFNGIDPNPQILFEQNLSKEDADKIRKIIKEVDDRKFDILSWVLKKF